MLVALWGTRPEPSGDVSQDQPPERRVRRGVTALEYLVCISFILAVIIITVQQLGSVVGGIFHHNAQATTTSKGP